MRTIIAITIVMLGMLITSCPKSNKLPASAPKLTINGQALSPIAWDTPGKSVRIQDPWGAEDSDTLRNLTKIPVYTLEEGNKLTVVYSNDWDFTKHGLYMLAPFPPERVDELEQQAEEYRQNPGKFEGDGSGNLPNPPPTTQTGDWVVLSAIGVTHQPASKLDNQLTYEWNAVWEAANLYPGFGLCALVTPYTKGIYLIYPSGDRITTPAEKAEQERALRELERERRLVDSGGE